MKSGQIQKVAKSFMPFFQSPWRNIGKEFFRRNGDWIQIIGFNACRFSEKYIPVNCFEFLKMPGPPTGSFLVQELHNARNTQRWVETTEISGDIFKEMEKRFIPTLLNPLSTEQLKQLLANSLSYWPHAYALCVMSVDDGDRQGAQRYFEAFLSATSEKPYPWVESRRQELTEIIALIDSPAELKVRFATIEEEKLRALKWKNTGEQCEKHS